MSDTNGSPLNPAAEISVGSAGIPALAQKQIRVFFAVFFGGAAVLILNLFVFEPALGRTVGPGGGMVAYIVIRLLTFFFVAYALSRYAGRNRFQVISTVLFLGFIDQVVLKGIGLHHEFHTFPEKWAGADTSNLAIFVNLSMVYLPFVPILVILSLFGIEATRFRREWKR